VDVESRYDGPQIEDFRRCHYSHTFALLTCTDEFTELAFDTVWSIESIDQTIVIQEPTADKSEAWDPTPTNRSRLPSRSKSSATTVEPPSRTAGSKLEGVLRVASPFSAGSVIQPPAKLCGRLIRRAKSHSQRARQKGLGTRVSKTSSP